MRSVVGTVTALLLGALFAPSRTLAGGLVTIGLGSRGRPVEAMNHRGDLLVAWESSGRDARRPYQLAGVVEVRFKPAGGSWQPIRSVHVPFNYRVDNGDVNVVKAVLDDRDRGFVLLAGYSVLRLRVLGFSPGRPLRLLEPDGSANDVPSDLAGNAAGDVAVAWMRSASNNLDASGQFGYANIQVATLRPGMSRFGPGVTVAAPADGSRPSGAVVGVDARGNVTLAWQEYVARQSDCCVEVFSSTKPFVAASFGPPEAVGLPSIWASTLRYQAPPFPNPSLAVAPSGRAVISYTHVASRSTSAPVQSPTDGPDYTLDNELVYRPAGGSFGAAMPLDPNQQTPVEAPSLSLAPNGTAYVYWNYIAYPCTQPLEDNGVWLASLTTGGLMTAARRLPQPGFGRASFRSSLDGMAFPPASLPLLVFDHSDDVGVTDPDIGYACDTINSQLATSVLRPNGNVTAARGISPHQAGPTAISDSGTGRVAIAWAYAPISCGDPLASGSDIQVRTIGLATGRNPYPNAVVPYLSGIRLTPTSISHGHVTIRLTTSQAGTAIVSFRRRRRHSRTRRLSFRVHRGVNVARVSVGRAEARWRSGVYTLGVTVINGHGGKSSQCNPNGPPTLRVR